MKPIVGIDEKLDGGQFDNESFLRVFQGFIRCSKGFREFDQIIELVEVSKVFCIQRKSVVQFKCMNALKENLPQTLDVGISGVDNIVEEVSSYVQLILGTSEAGEHKEKILALEEKFGKILLAQKLTGGKTNTVYKIISERGTFILKTGIGLEREKEFFGATTESSLIPKMYDFVDFGKKQCIVMELKSGENGKDVCDKIQNWEQIGQQMGKALHQIHTNKHQTTIDDKEKSVDDIINYISWGNSKTDLAELRKTLEESNLDIVNLHGDFSPHNCLFSEQAEGVYEVSAIFDPSGRISQGPAIFDIFYALNGRWVKDKPAFQKGFLSGYEGIDLESKEYAILSKVFTQYLKTLYDWMDSQEKLHINVNT